MISKQEIKDNVRKFYVKEDQVFYKSSNEVVKDENLILKVMTSFLIINEAKEAYQSDKKQFSKPKGNSEYYIDKTMQRFAVAGEVNDYSQNKTINGLLNSNGKLSLLMGGCDFANEPKFSFLFGKKKPYGLAYLRLKFRERGLDIFDFDITTDTSTFQKDGYSTINFEFIIKPFIEKTNPEVIQDLLSELDDTSNISLEHPKADVLNALETNKKEAKANDDEIAYKYYQTSIEKIVRENPLEIFPSDYDSMSLTDKQKFMQIKMKEAKVNRDDDEYNYWLTNYNNLKEDDKTASIRK